jgi:hypothetical protein
MKCEAKNYQNNFFFLYNHYVNLAQRVLRR